MLRWTDDAIVLSTRPWGETSLLATVLTHEHGRQTGLVKGGAQSRRRVAYSPGNRVRATWRARLPEHLGNLDCELVEARAARVLFDPFRLAGVSSVCALVESLLAEREPVPEIHTASNVMIDAIVSGADWSGTYVHWELGLLRATGAGLDLGHCALTGETEDLAYVSPRTGRAASRDAAKPWAKRLLGLPAFLVDGGPATPDEVAEGLALTGHFLSRQALTVGRRLPAARERLIGAFGRTAGGSA